MSTEKLQAKRLFGDRPRTNFLKKYEQVAISGLLPHVPDSFTPNILTGIGFSGSILVLIAFALSRFASPSFIWLAVAGLALNWIGDSLDGRLAYYRGIPRKWYGFSLDIVMDWLSTVVMGLGCMLYLQSEWGKVQTFLLVVLYGWAMIISQLRFKITGKYQIDSGIMGPTEFRIVLAAIIILEFFYTGYLVFFLGAITFILFIINILESKKLLHSADITDKEEKEKEKKTAYVL